MHHRSIPSVNVWGLEFFLFYIIGYETVTAVIGIIYTRLAFGEWDVSRGVTQAGMPQEKISSAIQRYS